MATRHSGHGAISRHQKYFSSRETHTSGGFDPTVPLEPDYGQRIDAEQIGAWQIPPGSVNDEIIQPEAVGERHIQGGAITIAKFAAGISPPRIVDTLPALPDPSWPQGAMVFLTTDNKLYRSTGTTWTKAVDGVDITADSITAGQIAAGAIGASEIAAAAVTASKLLVGATPRGQNLLHNAGFEEGDLPIGTYSTAPGIHGWATSSTPAVAGREAHANRTGAACLRLEGDGTRFFPVAAQQVVPVLPNRRYRLSGRAAKEVAGGSNVVLRATIRDNAAAILSHQFAINNTSADFVNNTGSIEFTTPSNAADVIVYCYVAGTAAVGEIARWDDVVLEAADFVAADGRVIIGGDGITIKDSNSMAMLTANGFEGSWLSYLEARLYNSNFVSGVIGNLPAGITKNLPFWDVKYVTAVGDGVFQRINDTTAGSGQALRYIPDSTGLENHVKIVQEPPVVPGEEYDIRANIRSVLVSGTGKITLNLLYDYLDINKNVIAGAGDGQYYHFTATKGWTKYGANTGLKAKAPSNAAYIQVRVNFFRPAADGGTGMIHMHIGDVEVVKAVAEVDTVLFRDYGVTIVPVELENASGRLFTMIDRSIEGTRFETGQMLARNIRSGMVTMTTVANTLTTVAVTGLNPACSGDQFTGQCTVNSTGTTTKEVTALSPSSDGITVGVVRETATSTNVFWLLIGKGSTNY